MVIGTVGPGDERIVDGSNNEYWFEFPEQGGALSFMSASPFAPKSTTGERSYQDYDVFSAIAFTDLSGGMGQDRAEDTTQYHDAQNVDTRGGRIILGPLVTATATQSPFARSNTLLQLWSSASTLDYQPVDINFQDVGAKFTTTANQTKLDRVWLPLKVMIAAGTATVKIYNDDAGEPGSPLAGAVATLNRDDLRAAGTWVQAVFESQVTVSPSITYWIVVSHAGASSGVQWYGNPNETNTPNCKVFIPAPVNDWVVPNDIEWHLMAWFDDPTQRPDGPLHYVLGAGKDNITRLWGYAGKYLYYIAANGTPTVVQDGAGAAYRAAADIVDAVWFQGSGATFASLYLALGDDTDMVKFDGEVGAEDWTAITGKQGRALAVHDNILWRADERNQVSGTILGDWTDAYPNAVSVGAKTYPVRHMLSWNGDLYVGKDSGLFKVTVAAGYPASDVTPVATNQLDFASQAGPRNFALMVDHQGNLYFNIQQGIIKYTSGGVVTAVTPVTGLNLSAAQRSEYLSGFSSLNVLWVTSEGGFGSPSSVLALVESKWHPIVTTAREADMMRGIYLEPLLYGTMPRIYFNQGLQVAYVQMPTTTQRRWLWSNTDYAASGQIDLSWIDGNLRTIEKDWVVVELDCRNLGTAPTGSTVVVYWRPDENTAWGGIVGLIGTVSADGITTLNFPANSHSSKAEVRLLLVRGTSTTSTPQVEAIVIKYLERPQDLRSFTRTYQLSSRGHWRNGAPRQESLAEQVAQLETLREAQEPLTWYSWWGSQYTVHIVDYVATEVLEARGDLMDQGSILVQLRMQALV